MAARPVRRRGSVRAARLPGRLLEPSSNRRSREMIVAADDRKAAGETEPGL